MGEDNISHIFLRNHDQSLFFTSKLNLINLYICIVGEMFQFPQMVLDIGLLCMQTYKCCTDLLNRILIFTSLLKSIFINGNIYIQCCIKMVETFLNVEIKTDTSCVHN